jgi:hypothetical protein
MCFLLKEVLVINLISNWKERNTKTKIVLILIPAAIFLLGLFVLLRVLFTNPAGVDNQFYDDYKYAYDTMSKAYEEERPLNVYEKKKIEDLIAKFEKERDEFYKRDSEDISDEDYDKLVNKSDIFTPIAIMYNSYDATSSFDDEDYQMDFLNEFLEQQQKAKEALGIN